MVTTNQAWEQQLKAFKQSSAFTPGDAFSFSIKFNEVLSLPGKYDPAAYLDKLGVDLSGNNCIVCPGNGGLCIELLKRGFQVSIFEPRTYYHQAITKVASFAAGILGKQVTNIRFQLNQTVPFETGCYDTIIWSEGLDEIRDPAVPLKTVLGGLRPGGQLIIELNLGSHDVLPTSINSWKPTLANFEASIKKLDGFEIVGKRPGRNQMRTIFTIKNVKVPPTTTVLASALPTETPVATKSPAANDPLEQSEEEKKALYESPIPDAPAQKRRPRKPKPPTETN